MKWCHRISLTFKDKIEQIKEPLSSNVLETIFLEGVDVFCGSFAKLETKKIVIDRLAQVWGISLEGWGVMISNPKTQVERIPPSLNVLNIQKKNPPKTHIPKPEQYAQTFQFQHLIYRISTCITLNESVLLTGETGVGKTSCIQFLSEILQKNLVVLNLNQQAESADLLGGTKPVEIRRLAWKLKNIFERIFRKTFSRTVISPSFWVLQANFCFFFLFISLKKNAAFFEAIIRNFEENSWKLFFTGLKKAAQLAMQRYQLQQPDEKKERQSSLENEWKSLYDSVETLENQFDTYLQKQHFAFSFVEGPLVKCLKEGSWVLLDEINLASSETLEVISDLLEGGSVCLTERGDTEPIVRHPDFRIFACMNPPTDVGKKDLPPGLRNRFTEYYVGELEDHEDLSTLVKFYLCVTIILIVSSSQVYFQFA